MPARYLRKLHDFGALSPREIRAKDPALFAEMQSRVLVRARAYLRTSFPRLSRALRDQLNAVDLPLADWPADRNPREVILDALTARNVPAAVREEANRLLTALQDADL